MILVAILLPPLAVLMVGKPFQALLNCALTLFFYFPGMIHAVLVVNSRNADKRHKEQLAAMYAARAVSGQPIVVAPMAPVEPAVPVPAEPVSTLGPGSIQ